MSRQQPAELTASIGQGGGRSAMHFIMSPRIAGNLARWVGLLALVIILAGCVTQRDINQARHNQPAGEIWGAQTVGQTFVSQENGLNRIDVLLATYARQNTGPVVFHLRESPGGSQDLATTRFDASDAQDNAYRSFTFPPISSSQGRSYYFFFEAPAAEPGNAITAWTSSIDAYNNGQAHVAGQPQSGDLQFRTYTEYSLTRIAHDLQSGLRNYASIGLLTLLLFLAPGAALLSLFGDWSLEHVILAAGLSVAIAPLVVLIASLTGVHLGRDSIIALLALSSALTLLSPLRHIRTDPFSPDIDFPIPSGSSALSGFSGPSSALLVVFIISLTVRLLVVRDLPAPMWGDSYHHTLIAQLLVDHGGLFRSWKPYAPLQSFTYHFGFHSNVALFHWLTGVPVLKSVIGIGQVLNVLAPLTLYPLVRRLGGSRWAGTIAVLIASLLSPMPARYVNWGRYTQLTGMVILPVAATLLIDATTSSARTWRQVASAGVAVAGLFLSHYLVTLVFLPLVLAYLLWWSVSRVRHRNQVSANEEANPRRIRGSKSHENPSDSRKTWFLSSQITRAWLLAGTAGVIAALLTLPWFLNLWHSRLPRILAGRFGTGPTASYFQTAYNVVGDFLLYVPAWLIVVAVAAAAWSIRRPLAIVTGLWTVLLILMANPHVIGLPGTGIVHNFMMLIALYLPLSMLASAGLGDIIQQVTDIEMSHILSSSRRKEGMSRGRASFHETTTEAVAANSHSRHRYTQLVGIALILIAAVVGARFRLTDLEYQYQLVTQADLEAMQWIRENIPQDAKFLVNAFTAFGGRTVVGDDAGWWIPYLANRRNTVPPAVYGIEASHEPNYPAQISTFHDAITAQPLDTAEAVRVLHDNGITHVYIGVVGDDLLDPTLLMESAHYRLIYSRDGAMVFEVDRN